MAYPLFRSSLGADMAYPRPRDTWVSAESLEAQLRSLHAERRRKLQQLDDVVQRRHRLEAFIRAERDSRAVATVTELRRARRHLLASEERQQELLRELRSIMTRLSTPKKASERQRFRDSWRRAADPEAGSGDFSPASDDEGAWSSEDHTDTVVFGDRSAFKGGSSIPRPRWETAVDTTSESQDDAQPPSPFAAAGEDSTNPPPGAGVGDHSDAILNEQGAGQSGGLVVRSDTGPPGAAAGGAVAARQPSLEEPQPTQPPEGSQRGRSPVDPEVEGVPLLRDAQKMSSRWVRKWLRSRDLQDLLDTTAELEALRRLEAWRRLSSKTRPSAADEGRRLARHTAQTFALGQPSAVCC
eukprot:TRINITY_DN22853_c0_g1_i2.p1 TRINITY_DN22853_c0_g1~~TRINITY_DN22853_c0_g1_i2.p1  ORF type:complete len:355 (-),score=57.74 TRINITY_DN22853_c0_g1_i2:176-1240(-)